MSSPGLSGAPSPGKGELQAEMDKLQVCLGLGEADDRLPCCVWGVGWRPLLLPLLHWRLMHLPRCAALPVAAFA